MDYDELYIKLMYYTAVSVFRSVVTSVGLLCYLPREHRSPPMVKGKLFGKPATSDCIPHRRDNRDVIKDLQDRRAHAKTDMSLRTYLSSSSRCHLAAKPHHRMHYYPAHACLQFTNFTRLVALNFFLKGSCAWVCVFTRIVMTYISSFEFGVDKKY